MGAASGELSLSSGMPHGSPRGKVGGSRAKAIVSQNCIDSDTETYPFGQLSGQSYRGVQSGCEMATVVQKIGARKLRGTNNANRSSKHHPNMQNVVQTNVGFE